MSKGGIQQRSKSWQERLVIGLIIALLAQPVLPLLLLAQQQPAPRSVTPDVRHVPITRLPDSSKRWALIIGVDKYETIRQLEGAENDAKHLAEALIKYAGFPKDQVIRLSTNQENPRFQPTRGAIEFMLSFVIQNVPPDGLLLFAFSGHGMEIDDKGTKRNCLLPKEAAHKDDDPNVVLRSSIDLEKVKQDIEKRGIQQVIMLIDSCRDDPTKGGRSIGADNTATESYLNRFNFNEQNSKIKAFVVLHASQAGQRAWEYPKEKMGFFTWAIVQALTGGEEGREAANQEGKVTLGGLIKYLEQKLPAKVKEVLQEKQELRYNISEAYGANELVLAVVPHTRGARPSGDALGASPEIDRGYWRAVKELNSLEAYRGYLKDSPNGQFVEEARQNIAKFEPVNWTKAESTKNPVDYQVYLDYFPTGPHAAEANKLLAARRREQQEEADWQQAKQENTKVSYRFYSFTYPAGRHVSEANLAVTNLEKSEEGQREDDTWVRAVSSSNSIAGYQAYLKEYPRGRYAADANSSIAELRRHEEERRENDAWELAKKGQSSAGYQAYLKDFQNGPHAADANAALSAINQREEMARQVALDDAAWEKARNLGSLQSYQEYLTAYPQGSYAALANTALTTRRLAEEEDTAWKRAKDGASKQSYLDYLSAYQQGRFVERARRSIAELERLEEEQRRLNLENAAWQLARNANTLASLQAYLRDYPAGRFVTEAGNSLAAIERAAAIKREDADWQQAQQGASVAAYQTYLTAYPQGRYLNEANSWLTEIRQRAEQQRLAALETEAWATAQRGATLAAYQTYLTAYPNGRFVTEAGSAIVEARQLEERRRLAAEDAVWTQVKQDNTLAIFQAYLKAYPQGRFITEANNGIAALNRLELDKRENATWTRAQQSASVAAYQAYLAEYPQGRFVTDAAKAITALKRVEAAQRLEATEATAWKQAQQNANLAGYQAYLRDYPTGKFAEEARKGLAEFERIEAENRQRANENNAWQQAQQGASLQSYQSYLAQYPAGRFVADANKELATIEDADWARSQRGASIESYQVYQTSYPNGRYATTAGNAIAELRLAALDEAAWQRAQQDTNVSAYQSYLTEYPRGRFVTEANQRITDLNLAAEAQRVAALDNAAWRQAQQNASTTAYQTYLNTYPKGRFVKEATLRLDESKRVEENQRRAALDEAAWTSARTNASLATYQGYLATYPNGRFATDANNAIAGLNRLEANKREDDLWQQAQKDNTLAAYLSYLTVYSAGRYVETANQRVTEIRQGQDLIAADENAWQTAQTGANLAAYQAYLKDYPNGRYVTSANNNIVEFNRIEANKREDQAWEQARNSASLTGYQAYLTDYPAGRFVEEANKGVAEFTRLEEAKREEQQWADAKGRATMADYRAYLASYPKGRFAVEAESLIRAIEAGQEDTVWEKARKDTSRAAFQTYLSAYPNGRFAAEANTRMAELNNAAALSTILTAPITPRVYPYNTKLLKATGEGWELTRRKANGFTQELGNQVALEMVAVKGGSFYMGTSKGEVTQVLEEYKRYQLDPALAEKLVARQQPPHRVKVEAFYLGKYEVTQAQWRAVAGLPKVKRELNPNPAYFKGAEQPIEQVSWEDAVEFCERLSRASGRQYRLPTEAEWEYAARAGSSSAFAFGETLTTQVANYHGSYRYGDGPLGEYRGTTVNVGSLDVANAFGLFDMHGNVSEWVQDAWRENYRASGVLVNVSNWGDRMRVIRGGSWNDRGSYCRSAHRTQYESYLYSQTIGFRVALSAPPSSK